MKVSVVMASCNQAHYVFNTCHSVNTGLKGCREWETVVVDDASSDGSCDKLPSLRNVKVVRSDTRLGCSQARRLAASHATGDIVILTDPHCLFPHGSLCRLAQKAAKSFAIYQPQVYIESVQHITSGCRPQIQSRGVRLKRVDAPAVPHRVGLLGSIYAMQRTAYDHLGGYPWLPGKWGKFETMLTLTAYRLGVPIYVDKGNVCLHLTYRRVGEWPFDFDQTDVACNNHWTHAAIFPDTYDDIWRPLLNRHHKKGGADNQAVADSLRHERFLAHKEHIRTHSLLAETDLYKSLFGVTHPSTHPRIRAIFDRWKP
jgi:glycosyltransferase involved in cell wall biosynthesis